MMKDIRNEKTAFKKLRSDKERKTKKINYWSQPKETIPKENAKLIYQWNRFSSCNNYQDVLYAPAGAEIKKTMFVKISAKIQKNRRVYENSIRIVDTNISKSSSVYGPITESAMRTLSKSRMHTIKTSWGSKYESMEKFNNEVWL